ncbi:zinc ABC transporter substrate-binding protein [Jannaschia sp. LMIT008]|uniref:zinc ABC transporter substrate-binding protein n=1 Tax=Jannaschia maritima TaxID=3032585 RepID=UPI0028110DC1|nr:zinc ABC transporter substrate-binding protein [Jannaschia sp. LMIT008]
MLYHNVLPAFAASVLATAAFADAPRVVTDIGPIHGLVAGVMDGVGEPFNVLPVGADPHDHALRPSEGRALQDAQVVFRTGSAMAPWLDRPLENLAGGATVVSLLEVEGIDLIERSEEGDHDDHAEHDEHAADDHAHDHAEHDHDDHDHAEEAAADHEDHEDHDGHDHAHDHGGIDPHAWLDPAIATTWVGTIAATLSDVDPANAQAYRANADALIADIAAARDEVAAMLADVPSRTYLAGHDAYGYLDRTFGLEPLGAVTDVHGEAPTPGHLSDLLERARAADLRCVLREPGETGALDTVIDGLSPTVVELDAAGSALEPGPGFYPALLRHVGSTFAGCLGATG